MLPHYTHGKNPCLLLVSDIHGDERGVIDSVKRAIEKHREHLPDFLHIPEVSPSAVALGTRVNSEGVDINRHFIERTACAEAQRAMDSVRGRAFAACFSFHEDPEHPGFYVYDSGTLRAETLAELRECIRGAGAELFSGIDDSRDELLGHEIREGYKPNIDEARHYGPFEGWLVREGVASRVFGVEVPGSVPQNVKDAIVDVVFQCLVLRHLTL